MTPGDGARTLGVVGTMVWDRIVPWDAPPVERWGGIGYTLAAAAVALPSGWTIRPIVKVGRDLDAEARELLASIPRLDTSRLRVVAEPNNRVELRYRDEASRTEHLTGGVPGWSAGELVEATRGCDALLVNYISGWETTLETAEAVFRPFGGPVYADVHSLVLDVAEDGTRVPRPLADWHRWMACFTWVQMNEGELAVLGGEAAGDSAGASGAAGRSGPSIEDVLDAGPEVVAVTRGSAGATVATRGDDGRALVRDVTISRPRSGEPTGCGDVWAATMCAALVHGLGSVAAAARANRAAAASVDHVGVEGLHGHLRAAATHHEGGEA